MNQYLTAIGFGDIESKKELYEILTQVERNFTHHELILQDEEMDFCEFQKEPGIVLHSPRFPGFVAVPKSREVKLDDSVSAGETGGYGVVDRHVGSPPLEDDHRVLSVPGFFIRNLISIYDKFHMLNLSCLLSVTVLRLPLF